MKSKSSLIPLMDQLCLFSKYVNNLSGSFTFIQLSKMNHRLDFLMLSCRYTSTAFIFYWNRIVLITQSLTGNLKSSLLHNYYCYQLDLNEVTLTFSDGTSFLHSLLNSIQNLTSVALYELWPFHIWREKLKARRKHQQQERYRLEQ